MNMALNCLAMFIIVSSILGVLLYYRLKHQMKSTNPSTVKRRETLQHAIEDYSKIKNEKDD